MTPKQQINADIKVARQELKEEKTDLRNASRRVIAIEKDIAKMQAKRAKL